ncbi:unnamed protein product [Lupinus luteus]|uniref:Pectin acetylesterase n=1 Tax=Lupinus luteus TaxID=3873 RepID=A0AAV1WGL4_LUPLU
MAKLIAFSGILGNKQLFNPDFYNWKRIKVRYYDGASFTGDVEAVNHVIKLHFRGTRVFTAVIEDLFAPGMKNARNIGDIDLFLLCVFFSFHGLWWMVALIKLVLLLSHFFFFACSETNVLRCSLPQRIWSILSVES